MTPPRAVTPPPTFLLSLVVVVVTALRALSARVRAAPSGGRLSLCLSLCLASSSSSQGEDDEDDDDYEEDDDGVPNEVTRDVFLVFCVVMESWWAACSEHEGATCSVRRRRPGRRGAYGA